ncbi:YgfZ/GcvT domain-containing protein [Sphingorhabdus sp.]|uniref:CAF17-like 4Fe-4S cluster assembly/insertion protein YgfZ n=1 Tax=Sphingorhabdus sp. TaxID=1902408 RepID=UPI003983D38E
MPNTRLFDRSIIRLSPTDAGEDVRQFLQGLVTQDTAANMPSWAGLLSPQGKALFDFILWADSDDVLIDCESTQMEGLIRRLSMYRLRRQIAIAVDLSCAVYWRPEGNTDPRHPDLGERWLGTPAPDDVDVSAAYRARRLALGITEGVAELGSDQTLWLEANAAELNGVSFTKGCYVGQENTARMNWRQKVNRRLVVVPLADADPKRQRLALDQLGLSVELRRIEDMAGLILPDWQRAAIA